MELDFAAVDTQVAAINSAVTRLITAVPKLQTGVNVLKAENEALRQALPNAQIRLNGLAASLGQVASGLNTTANSVQEVVDGLPVIPPPAPPGG